MNSIVSANRNLPVVVGIDGSRTHLATVDLAVTEAVRRGAPLVIVHAWPGRYSGSFRPRGPVPTEADGRHLLDVAARRAEHTAPGLAVSTHLAAESAVHILVQHSENARLLVVGHRDATLIRPSWGSTATYLAHHGACPLLVHRGAAPDQGPVVLAASTRDSATPTVACAYEEAALSGSRLVAVHVWTHPAGQGAASPVALSAAYAEDRREADVRLVGALAGWASRFPDVTVERLVLHDLDVAYTLERASRRGRLLVAGMGRNGRFAELLYGSLGLALMRQAVCPVLLVPSGWRHPLMKTPPEGVAAAAERT